MNSTLQIIALPRASREVDRFLDLAYAIYGRDPHWVAPLLRDVKKTFSDANPLFEHAEMQLWMASRDGRDVGRIAGIIDRHHNEFHRERTAFFGFFESVDDPAVSAKLFAAVAAWARPRGMTRLLGPMNPTTNDECGLLVDGFDSPPVFMLTYNPRYYVPLVEAAGCTKAKDLLAYDFDLASGPQERLGRFMHKFRRREPDVVITPILKKNLATQLAKIKTVYNQAWAENWGFVPMTDGEIDFLAGRLKPLVTEGLAMVAETPQGPSGFLLAMPDFNEALQPLRGRFLSPGLWRAIPYFLGAKRPKYLRCVTLGVVPQCRGRGIEAAMLSEVLNASLRLGFQRGEASWILEENTAVQRVIGLFGGVVYKTYRIYECAV